MGSEEFGWSHLIDSPAKYREIEEDSSQSGEAFSTSLLRRKTAKRKLLVKTESSNCKIPEEFPIDDVFEDSPTKYQAIDDVDSQSQHERSPNATANSNSQSTGYGLALEDFRLQLQRTPPTKTKRRPSSNSSANFNSSFMLRRFLAESPKTPATDIFDDSPLKSPGFGLYSQRSHTFYNTPPKKVLGQVENDPDLDPEVTIIPESPSIQSENDHGRDPSSLSLRKSLFSNKEFLDKTPPPMKKTKKINSRRLNFQRELSSEEILEDYSPCEGQGQTQEPFISIPFSLTPKRRNRVIQVQTESNEITVDDSPSKSELELQLQKDRLNSGISLSKIKLNLSGQLKKAVAHHNFTLRSWTSKLQKLPDADPDFGLTEILSLYLVKIHKLASNHEKGGTLALLSLCVDLDNSNHDDLLWKWVIFKTNAQNHKQFISGLSAVDKIVKIHSPWQEIFLPNVNEEVMICTDFVEFVDSAQLDRFSTVKSSVQQTKTLVDQKFASFLKSCPSHPNLFPLIPYRIRNHRTIQKQMLLHRRSIELEVVVCYAWEHSEQHIGVLVKDSDEILSYIQISVPGNSIKLIPGMRLRILGLICPRKVTPQVSLQLFSIIATFGHKQTRERYYYKLLSTKDTTWEIEPSLEIPWHECNCTEINVKELLEVPNNGDDLRFHVDGKIRLPESLPTATSTLTPTPTPLLLSAPISVNIRGITEFYLHDVDDSNFKIRVKVLPSFGSDRILGSDVNLSNFIQLGFLRLFRGIATLDQFSSLKQLE